MRLVDMETDDRKRAYLILVAAVFVLIASWCVMNSFGQIATYSAYYGEPGEESLVKKAHLLTLVYTGGFVLFSTGTTVFTIRLIKDLAFDALPVTRFIISSLLVLGGISGTVFL